MTVTTTTNTQEAVTDIQEAFEEWGEEELREFEEVGKKLIHETLR